MEAKDASQESQQEIKPQVFFQAPNDSRLSDSAGIGRTSKPRRRFILLTTIFVVFILLFA